MRNTLNGLPFLIAILNIGCFGFDTDGITEYQDLTYKEYKNKFATREVDPLGAKSISIRGYFIRDGYDDWWKMKISKEDWLKMIGRMEIGDPQPFQADSQFVKTLGVPNSWPDPDCPAPDWWLPQANFGSLIITKEVQEKEGERALGWYWLYDEPTSTAIGWHWNQQYVWLQPSKDPPDLRNNSLKDRDESEFRSSPARVEIILTNESGKEE